MGSERWLRSIVWGAGVLSVTVVPLLWVREVGYAAAVGSTSRRMACAVLILLPTVFLAGRYLRGRLPVPARCSGRFLIGLAMVLVWSAVISVSVLTRWQIWGPKWCAAVTTAMASWHLLWWLWMAYLPLRWPTRWGVLVLLLLGGIPLFWLFEFEGIAGQGEPILSWRLVQPYRSSSLDDAAAKPTSTSHANDYPQFLGPARTGAIDDVQMAAWNIVPPRVVWRREVGAGWGAFAVADGVSYTQEQQGEQECVVAYRLSDGELLWRYADALRFTSGVGGDGPRATPTVMEGMVVTVGGTGRLNCLDAVTGKRIWHADIGGTGALLPHGTAGSPLVVPPLVVVCPANEGHSGVAAYDLQTGELRWQNLSHPSSYASAALARIAGVDQVLVHQQDALRAFDVQDGRELWQFPWTNSTQTIASQPIVHAGATDRVLVSIGYGTGAALLQVTQQADGWATRQLWTSRHLKTKFCSTILAGDTLFALDDGILVAVDLTNGQLRWKQGRYGHGQLLRAGDTLIVVSERGEIVQVAAEVRQFRELGRVAALSSKTWNHPALAWPYLLVRNDREAVCLRLDSPNNRPNPL